MQRSLSRPIKTTMTAVALVATLGLGACQTTGENEAFGSVLGAALGGWAGSQIGSGDGQLAATAAGALLGAYVGGQVGASMDEVDRQRYGYAQQAAYSAPIGERIVWNNPDSGNYGAVTPVRDGFTQSGDYCREFQTEITVGGQSEDAYGTACRQEDGSWEIVSN